MKATLFSVDHSPLSGLCAIEKVRLRHTRLSVEQTSGPKSVWDSAGRLAWLLLGRSVITLTGTISSFSSSALSIHDMSSGSRVSKAYGRSVLSTFNHNAIHLFILDCFPYLIIQRFGRYYFPSLLILIFTRHVGVGLQMDELDVVVINQVTLICLIECFGFFVSTYGGERKG